MYSLEIKKNGKWKWIASGFDLKNIFEYRRQDSIKDYESRIMVEKTKVQVKDILGKWRTIDIYYREYYATGFVKGMISLGFNEKLLRTRKFRRRLKNEESD